MSKIDPSTIRPSRGLWAAAIPKVGRHGGWIAHDTISPTAKSARAKLSEGWLGGWPDLRKRGWRIIRVDVIPHEEGKDAE